jgi:hypothetical protein
MPFSFALSACLDHSARPSGTPVPHFYPTDRLPAMQSLLAAVADAETRYEIEREQIEQGSGSEEDKERALAELRAAHEQGRGLHEARWAELQAASAEICKWAR